MHFLLILLITATLALATPDNHNGHCGTYASNIEGLTQAGYKTGWILDGKNWTALPEVFAQDLYYDSSELGDYGGVSHGIDEARKALQAASQDTRTERMVTNLWLKEMVGPGKARVLTQITLSHWHDKALEDIKKTYRIYYMCDDIWIREGGEWKMWKSYVHNMGPGVEAPYFGKGNPLLQQY
ncbi:hypothetical protein PRZ48_006106 [Zasmidium cellare]|uniref:SnoaL-like domain-containing protein n=1 Tax=Zasmidium cellare TaxID=395010 RepID=A0ABR0END4_ZASCE|nr:hypothetical protein PRZ48_006106 [Zasmidium cellare]